MPLVEMYASTYRRQITTHARVQQSELCVDHTWILRWTLLDLFPPGSLPSMCFRSAAFNLLATGKCPVLFRVTQLQQSVSFSHRGSILVEVFVALR